MPASRIGILANAKAESNFDCNIVSFHGNCNGVESSLGLWQMNVQSEGSVVSVPKSSMTISIGEASLPQSIRIPSSSSVIVYFAGGQLAKKNGVSVITPTLTTQGGNQDVGQVYEIVTDSD